MTPYENVLASLEAGPKAWLVTGVAGFIGSNLLEKLLSLDQTVVGLDNFSTGHRRNLDEVQQTVEPNQRKNFSFVEGDIRDLETCRKVCAGADCVLHQAALGSVPRSIENPILTNASNVTGFLNMLWAAKEAAVEKFVYAASSSTYGDCPEFPKKPNASKTPRIQACPILGGKSKRHESRRQKNPHNRSRRIYRFPSCGNASCQGVRCPRFKHVQLL